MCKKWNKGVISIAVDGHRASGRDPVQQDKEGRSIIITVFPVTLYLLHRPALSRCVMCACVCVLQVMGVSGVKCWVALACCCLLLSQLTSAAPPDYDGEYQHADAPPHTLEPKMLSFM